MSKTTSKVAKILELDLACLEETPLEMEAYQNQSKSYRASCPQETPNLPVFTLPIKTNTKLPIFKPKLTLNQWPPLQQCSLSLTTILLRPSPATRRHHQLPPPLNFQPGHCSNHSQLPLPNPNFSQFPLPFLTLLLNLNPAFQKHLNLATSGVGNGNN